MKFKIGNSPGIVFRLPSKKPGDGNTLVGNIIVDIYKLKCSENVELQIHSIDKFLESTKKLYSDLEGAVNLRSEKGNFSVKLSVTTTGFILVDCKISKYEFDRPYDSNWSAEGTFSFVPDILLSTIKEIEAQS